MKEIIINTKQHDYPILIGSNIIDQLPFYLKKAGITNKTNILIITDSNVADLYLNLIKKMLKEYKISTYVVRAGEKAKSLSEVENLIQFAIETGLDRTSAIIAFGGGVVGDLAGFVSAIYMRGITFIQCPTTILAHDSSVGGKVGINHPLGKNLLGAFHQPKLVFYDTAFISTLPKREISAGLAEVIKHGLIKDIDFVEWLDSNVNNILELNLEALNHALLKGIEVKAGIVMQDEREQSIRAILNYGHTLAHVLETITDYQYLHGEAVAIGMNFAAMVAQKLNLVNDGVVDYTYNLLQKFNLPVTIPKKYNIDEMIKIMMRDKKNMDNQLRMVLPVTLGEVIIKDNINKNIIFETIQELQI